MSDGVTLPHDGGRGLAFVSFVHCLLWAGWADVRWLEQRIRRRAAAKTVHFLMVGQARKFLIEPH